MGFFGKKFGGEKVKSVENVEANNESEYPKFKGQEIEKTQPLSPEEKHKEISAARDAVINAYGHHEKNEGMEMDFETVEKKTVEFFNAIQDLCEGMNLYHGQRFGWPDNCKEFMNKFGGEDFSPQKAGELYSKMSFATMLVDAEIKRRRTISESGGQVAQEEKVRCYNRFQYPLYKVYIPAEMGGSAWSGFDKNKFQIEDPAAGLGGTYEKFFGSDQDPDRKILAEKAISLYEDLAPFMDEKKGRSNINTFLTKNRDRKIEGFRKRVVAREDVVSPMPNDTEKEIVGKTIDLYNLMEDKDEEIYQLEDRVDDLAKRGNDTYTMDQIQRMQTKIRDINDEKIIIRKLTEEQSGQTTIDEADFKKRLYTYADEQRHIVEVLSDKQKGCEKSSDEFRQFAKARANAKRRMNAATRLLNL